MSDAAINVLVIDDSEQDLKQLKDCFAQAEASEFQFTHVRTMHEALQLFDEDHFDCIILEPELRGVSGFEAFNMAATRAPDLPLVVLSRRDDDVLAMRIAQAGGQDYLVKDQTGCGMLVRTIRYALERHRLQVEQLRAAQDEDGSKTISFIGAKGGTGTTMVAVNVAAALGQRYEYVSLLELRADYGSLAVELNRTPEHDLSHLLKMSSHLLGRQEVEAALFDLPFGVRVLYGPQDVSTFGEIEPEYAAAIINALAEMSDFVIIDLPCDQSPATQLAIRLSDFVCMTVKSDVSSVKAARVRLKQLQAWDLDLDKVGAVVVTPASSAANLKLPAIEDYLQCRIVGVVLPAPEACARAIEVGQPLVIIEPEQVAAATLAEMAERLAADEVRKISH
jgi:MinD-like ATPase involved in chromosome partitioning or flagellar assembly/CheY-like chemotaxis protein